MKSSTSTRVGWLVGAVALAVLGAACAPDVPLVDPPRTHDPVVAFAEPDTVPPLRMRGADLVDGTGRIVLIHGMNSVNKSSPFISLLESGWLGDAERDYLRNSGFNAVRLGVSYAALMPSPGVIDTDYLDRVVEVVDQLSDDGLWVQLDFHQDVFHMMPEWATPPDARSLSAEAPSWASGIGWAAGYLSPRSIRQWDAFVRGEAFVVVAADDAPRTVASVLGDAAAALAGRVADRDHVIGIELLNEPFSGTPVVQCIVDGCFGRDRLLSERYSEMIAPIRVAAPEMPVWMEPFAPTGYVASPSMPRPATADASDGPQLGLAWHLYCNATDGGEPELADAATATFCDARFRQGFAAGSKLGRQLGGPRMLNEFGASRNPLDATLVTRAADEQFVSWMYWHGETAVSPTDSTIEDVVESQIIRPYPQATAGRPGRLSYDPATGAFSYSFTPDPEIAEPTSIVVPSRAYPTGYDVAVDHGTVTSAAQAGQVTVVPDGSGAKVTVRLVRVAGG